MVARARASPRATSGFRAPGAFELERLERLEDHADRFDEAAELLLVAGLERPTVAPVQKLRHREHAPGAVLDRQAQDGARAESRLRVDLAVEARVGVGVVDADRLAALR